MSSPVAQLDGYRGGVVHAIGEEETHRLWERYSGSHESFHRPPTGLNRLIDWPIEHLFRRRELKVREAEDWLESSLTTFAEFVDDPRLLDQVRQGTLWFVCDSAPPDRNVWSGECRLDKDRSRPPITFLYTRSMACRLPRGIFDLGWSGALDHFVGHLYPYFEGHSDSAAYDEVVACRNQHFAAQIRAQGDWRFRIAAFALPIIYRFHKRIELDAYGRVGAAE